MVRDETVALLTSKRKEEGRFPKRKLGTKVTTYSISLMSTCKGPTWRIRKLEKATKSKTWILV